MNPHATNIPYLPLDILLLILPQEWERKSKVKHQKKFAPCLNEIKLLNSTLKLNQVWCALSDNQDFFEDVGPTTAFIKYNTYNDFINSGEEVCEDWKKAISFDYDIAPRRILRMLRDNDKYSPAFFALDPVAHFCSDKFKGFKRFRFENCERHSVMKYYTIHHNWYKREFAGDMEGVKPEYADFYPEEIHILIKEKLECKMVYDYIMYHK